MEMPVCIKLLYSAHYHCHFFFPAYPTDYVRQFNGDRTGKSTLSFRECQHRECHNIAILEDHRLEGTENFFVAIEKGHGVIPRMIFTDVEAEILIEDVRGMYVLLWTLSMMCLHVPCTEALPCCRCWCYTNLVH